jgi:hypothetical protein
MSARKHDAATLADALHDDLAALLTEAYLAKAEKRKIKELLPRLERAVGAATSMTFAVDLLARQIAAGETAAHLAAERGKQIATLQEEVKAAQRLADIDIAAAEKEYMLDVASIKALNDERHETYIKAFELLHKSIEEAVRDIKTDQ